MHTLSYIICGKDTYKLRLKWRLISFINVAKPIYRTIQLDFLGEVNISSKHSNHFSTKIFH